MGIGADNGNGHGADAWRKVSDVALSSHETIPGNYFTDGKPMYLDWEKRIPKLGDCMEKRRKGNAWSRK